MDLKETKILSSDIENHWYYRSKALAMMRIIDTPSPSRVLDVGAGSGYFAHHLLLYNPVEQVWCVDTNYEIDYDVNQAGKSLHFRRTIDKVDANIMLFMDVLEHVEDDIALLKAYTHKVPRGCKVFISVPAFQSLWSGHDIFLGHKRRYTLRELEKRVRDAGLRVNFGCYFFAMILPIAAAIRWGQRLNLCRNKEPQSQLTIHNQITNNILLSFCRSELSFFRYNRLFGLTVLCYAETI